MLKQSISAALLVSLAACQNAESLRPEMGARTPPSRLDEIAYINMLRQALVVPTEGAAQHCFDGRQLRPFAHSYAEGTERNYAGAERIGAAGEDACLVFRPVPTREGSENSGPSMRRYIDAGFGLTDIYCERFFTVATASQARRNFARDTVSDVQTLVNSILTFSGAGEIAVGVTGATLGAVEGGFGNFDNAFLVAPDMAEVRELVASARGEFRARYRTNEQLPPNYEAARSVIEGYAGLCSFTNMRRMISVSIQEARAELEDTTQARLAETEDDTKPPSPPAVAAPTIVTGEPQS